MAGFCTSCGKELIKGAGFCPNCGIKVEKIVTPPQPVIPPEPIQQQQDIYQQPIPLEPPKKSNKKLFAIIGIIVIAIVIIALLFLFVILEDDSTSTNTAETDIIGAWRMTFHSQLGSDPDTLDTNWIFKNDGTIYFDPPVSDGFDEYSISSEEICFSDKLGIYYPIPRCYEYNFGASNDSLTLTNDVVTMTFIRIV